MLTWQQQFDQDINEMQQQIIETYLTILDRCEWQEFDQAEQLVDRMADQVRGLETYIQVLGGHHD